MKWFWVIFLFLVLSMCAMSVQHSRAHGFKPTPLPYSCDQVRWALTNFSRTHLMQLAKTMGINITATQRRQAEKCTKGG